MRLSMHRHTHTLINIVSHKSGRLVPRLNPKLGCRCLLLRMPFAFNLFCFFLFFYITRIKSKKKKSTRHKKKQKRKFIFCRLLSLTTARNFRIFRDVFLYFSIFTGQFLSFKVRFPNEYPLDFWHIPRWHAKLNP